MSKTEDPTDQDIVDAFDDLEEDEQHALVSLAKTLGYSDPVQRAREAATSRRGFLGTVAGATAAGTMAYSAGKAQAGTNQVGTIGTETKPVDVEAEDIVAASIDTPRLATDGRSAEWVVYNDGSTWYADGPGGETGTSGSDPDTVLQYAFDNASNTVKLRDSIWSGDPIATTITIPSGISFIGPGNRGAATVYGDADPVFRKEGLGVVRDLWVRGDHDNAGAKGDNDLIFCHEMGRGSLVANVTVSRTEKSGLVLAGCQQMTFLNISTSATGSSLQTGGIKLQDNDAGNLGTNACEFIGLHFHGSAEAGPWITQESVNGHGAGLVNHYANVNGENGPPGQPCFYFRERDQSFSGCHIMGIDSDVTAIWELVAGPPRCTFNDIVVGGAPARVWNITGAGITVDGAIIETGANTVIQHNNIGQASNPDRLSDIYAPEASVFIDAAGFGTIEMQDVDTSGALNVNRSNLYLSNCTFSTVNGANQSDNHARLRASDTRDGLLTFTGLSTNSSGELVCSVGNQREVKFAGENVTVDTVAFKDTGSFVPSYWEYSTESNDGDNDMEVVRVTVYDDTGATPGSGVVTADVILTAL